MGKTTVIFNLFLQSAWLDYNHLYVFGKSFHQQEYKVLKKGLEADLSKQAISNVFKIQEALGNISPLNAIETFSGVRNGRIRADFYDDCQDIPDPSTLDPMLKNLLLLDDCFLVSRKKPRRTTLEVDTTIAIRYTLLKTISDYLDIQFEKIQTLLSCSYKTRRISHISMLSIVQMIYPSWNSNSFVMGYGVRSTTF